MRGKVARELRKHVNFVPSAPRSYTEHEVTVHRKILSMKEGEDGKLEADLVWRDVPAFITECVDAKRNLYRFLKRKYMNLDYEMSVTRLPSEDDLAELAYDIMKDEELKEEVQNKNTVLTESTDSE